MQPRSSVIQPEGEAEFVVSSNAESAGVELWAKTRHENNRRLAEGKRKQILIGLDFWISSARKKKKNIPGVGWLLLLPDVCLFCDFLSSSLGRSLTTS